MKDNKVRKKLKKGGLKAKKREVFAKKKGTELDEDAKKMFEKLYRLSGELQDKTNKFYEISGYSPKDVETLLGNPKNFSEAQWKEIQKQQSKAEQFFNQVKGVKEVKKSVKKKRQLKSRSGKTLGARKGWISM